MLQHVLRVRLLETQEIVAHTGTLAYNLVHEPGLGSNPLQVSFCEFGSLVSSLRTSASNGKPHSMDTKLRMCREIAQGMVHITGQRILHRDLAARNVLLGTGYVCKIADFGLSRSLGGEDGAAGTEYYKAKMGVFPVKWTAWEAMAMGKYSVASDAWSYAITVVEIFQNGEQPYPKMSNPEVITLVTDSKGYHPQPTECPDDVYAILATCWHQEPAVRPTFASLVVQFVDLGKSRAAAQRSAEHDGQVHELGTAEHAHHHDLRPGTYDNDFRLDSETSAPFPALIPERSSDTLRRRSDGEVSFVRHYSSPQATNLDQPATRSNSAPTAQVGEGRRPSILSSGFRSTFEYDTNSVTDLANIDEDGHVRRRRSSAESEKMYGWQKPRDVSLLLK